jgi:gamma-glutamylcyclotransferase (GGCT)/AIG2-like uncharacterized protein YtfP
VARQGQRRPGWSTQANEIVSRLFAYGTFRAGEPARALIAAHVASSEPATTRGTIYAFPEGHPGLVAEPDGVVVGELLELGDLAAALALLDAYEGEGYERTLRQVEASDGRREWAWCYRLRDPNTIIRGERIPGGDWVAWRRGAR